MGMVAAAVIMYLKSNIGSFEILHTIYYLYIHTYSSPLKFQNECSKVGMLFTTPQN